MMVYGCRMLCVHSLTICYDSRYACNEHGTWGDAHT